MLLLNKSPHANRRVGAPFMKTSFSVLFRGQSNIPRHRRLNDLLTNYFYLCL